MKFNLLTKQIQNQLGKFTEKKKNGSVHLKRVSYTICKIWFSEVIRKEKEMQIKNILRYHILTY